MAEQAQAQIKTFRAAEHAKVDGPSAQIGRFLSGV
jgi:hypothetical protein